jgi:heptosyltransferase-3
MSGLEPRIDIAAIPPARVDRVLAEAGVPAGARLVILHPGSGASARDWNWRKFASLAGKLGMLNGVAVLITGGRGEEGLVGKIRSACPVRTYAVVGSLGLIEYAALAARASVFIANSTGPLHIAAAVGTPVVGLYPLIRPLSAARWGPYTDRKAILSPRGHPEDCSGCRGAAGEPCECMDSISVEDVFGAAVKLAGVGTVVS